MKLEEIDNELDLEDLKRKLDSGAKIMVASNYSHSHEIASSLGFVVEKDEEGQLVQIIEEDDRVYRYFIDEAEIKSSDLPPIGKYQFKVDFGGRIGEYNWSILRDPGYSLLPESEQDPQRIERIFRLKRIEYPENPRQLHFNF
ncbi:MAG: hypothetical protein AABX10_04910 [Nanoarchaeota archaeon]